MNIVFLVSLHLLQELELNRRGNLHNISHTKYIQYTANTGTLKQTRKKQVCFCCSCSFSCEIVVSRLLWTQKNAALANQELKWSELYHVYLLNKSFKFLVVSNLLPEDMSHYLFLNRFSPKYPDPNSPNLYQAKYMNSVGRTESNTYQFLHTVLHTASQPHTLKG